MCDLQNRSVYVPGFRAGERQYRYEKCGTIETDYKTISSYNHNSLTTFKTILRKYLRMHFKETFMLLDYFFTDVSGYHQLDCVCS